MNALIWMGGIAWVSCGIAGWRIVLYRFGRNCGLDDAMIGPSMLIGPIALWIALRSPQDTVAKENADG